MHVQGLPWTPRWFTKVEQPDLLPGAWHMLGASPAGHITFSKVGSRVQQSDCPIQ